MTPPLFIVPTLTLWESAGKIDAGATAAYAGKAAETWVNYFFLSGSIGGGNASTSIERRETLEVWLNSVSADRLLACAWVDEDFDYIKEMGVRAVAVLQGLETPKDYLDFLGSIPNDSFIYSHPSYSKVTFDANTAELAAQSGVLPAGAKVSKIGLDEMKKVRSSVGTKFLLFDGRSRDIEASVQSGADGVVVVPLSILPDELPDRTELASLQSWINQTQRLIDAEPHVPAQANVLTRLLRQSL